MQLITDYMRNDQYRHMLNEMTEEIFGFSFENWYIAGCFEDEYIPFSYIENGKILANASANIMKMSVNGVTKQYIQIGTVMTRPEYRNRGLAKTLIETILKEYDGNCDGFYLFSNLNAVGYYEKIGFLREDQHQWHLKTPVSCNNYKTQFVEAGKRELDHYRHVLGNARVNAALDQINRRSLQLFYTLDMENVYYCEELDCFAVMEIRDGILYLDSVVSTKELSIVDVLERINGEYTNTILGFAPKDCQELFEAGRFDGGDDYRLFYLGEDLAYIFKDRLFFPVMSHA